VAGELYKFGYTKFADFFDNDRQTFDHLSATFRQFKNWTNWIVSISDNYFTREESNMYVEHFAAW
jgi:homoserine acetyltransferase